MQTEFDYLICVKASIAKDEMGSFPVNPQYGAAIKENKATAELRIYNLNNLTLISKGKIEGVLEVKRRANEKNLDNPGGYGQ